MTGRTTRLSARALFASALLTAMSASGLHAQSAQKAGAKTRTKAAATSACPAPDTTATWYRGQQAWLDERTAQWTDDKLRTALLGASGASEASNGALLGYEITDGVRAAISATDATLIAQLKAVAAERGSTWPTKSVVGARGVLAVWGLAAQDTALARAALKRMMEAGPDESPPAAVAILEDRQRVRLGRKQLYGTQLTRAASGALEPLPIEDMAHLALRRDGAELPPLAQSVCAANARANPAPRPGAGSGLRPEPQR